MTALDVLWVALAGGAGAGLRFLVDNAVMRGRRDAFPLGILIVNVTGCLALGVVEGVASGTALAILGVGLLGGYTTFSTVAVETVLLAERGRRDWAWGDILGTLVLSLAAAAVGIVVGGIVSR